ncbi:MAG: hypothetical protein WD024_03630 [Bacillota bacterium]
MKPIDVVTGLPRSAEVARLLATQGRHGEIETQGQVSAFAREMRDRQSSVNEAPKAEGGQLDAEGGGEGGGAFYDAPGDKRSRDGEKESQSDGHPAKGKILDIRGS